MWKDERGIALPIVIALSIILFVLTTVAISQSLRNRQIANLHQEMIRVQYAAESGLAHVQSKLVQGSSISSPTTLQMEGIPVQVLCQPSPLRMTSTAYGRFGVKQTVTAFLSPMTYEVNRWVK